MLVSLQGLGWNYTSHITPLWFFTTQGFPHKVWGGKKQLNLPNIIKVSGRERSFVKEEGESKEIGIRSGWYSCCTPY